MKTISVNGALRPYDEEGTGPPIVLVHGTASTSRQWRTLSEVLRNRYRVLSPDFGLAVTSDGEAKPAAFDFAADCALVAALIESAGGTAHLLGHSYGGVVAVKTALDRPSSVTSLILIEPSCFHLLEETGQAAEYAEITAVRDRQQRQFTAGDLVSSARDFVEYWMGPEAWRTMPERRQRMIVAAVPKIPHDFAGTLAPVTRLDDYRAFSVPTLLMRAKDTKRPSFRIVDLLAGVLPHHAVAEIAQGGHMSPLTNPESVNAAIAAFLDGGIRPTG